MMKINMSGNYYNTKIVKYLHGVTVKTYRRNIHRLTDKEKEERRKEREIFKSATTPLEGNAVIKNEKKSIENSVNRTKSKIYDIAQSNEWNWFMTFTFDPKKYPSDNYESLTKLMSKWLQRIKERYASNLKYILVPELHKDGKKYHFHGLFSDCGDLEFIEPFNINGVNNYHLKQYKFGFNTATLVNDSSRVSSYITKYITKELCTVTKGKKRYWASRNLEKANEEFLQADYDTQQQILESLGGADYVKSIDIPVSYNHLTIYNIDY